MPDQRANAGAVAIGRHPPLHQVIGEIGDRIAERRELPVEHGANLRTVMGNDAIVETVVAMDQRDRAAVRHRCRQEALNRSISAILSVSKLDIVRPSV